jgi:hypothetical protein
VRVVEAVTFIRDFGILQRMKTFLSVICLAFSSGLLCSAAEPAKQPAKENLHIYVLMGQSNMAGRGVPENEDKTPHPRVLMFATNNTWLPAVEPLTKDPHKFHGVGPGLAFGKAMAEKNPTITIGLVPTAVGGTPLSRWQKGADLYENAVRRAKRAMQDGKLCGVIWHQGESDTGTEENANSYGTRLAKMISDLRTDLNAPDLPFVAGELGYFIFTRTNKPVPLAKVVNAAIRDLPKTVPHTGWTSAHDLTDKGDQLHFDAKSQREFGRRYADVMMKVQGK